MPQRQHPQHLDDAQERHGHPERGLADAGHDRDDQGGHGQDGEYGNQASAAVRSETAVSFTDAAGTVIEAALLGSESKSAPAFERTTTVKL